MLRNVNAPSYVNYIKLKMNNMAMKYLENIVTQHEVTTGLIMGLRNKV